jgi:hypothetical protein
VTDIEPGAGQPGFQPGPLGNPAFEARRSLTREAVAAVGRHKRIARSLGLVLVAMVIGTAYVVGGPPAPANNLSPTAVTVAEDGTSARTYTDAVAPVAPGASMGPATGVVSSKDQATTTGNGQSPTLAGAQQEQVIKTGQISLEVADIEAATAKAESVIFGLGGKVDSSYQQGSGDQATATLTFRVPVAKWDQAISAMKGIGTRVIVAQTGTSDVTLQAVDLDARIANLRSTEAALQSIMTRATAIADVIAVEKELSNVQGQIEELTAARTQLANQAEMSTLTLSLQLPAKTVTTQATEGWTLSKQVDEAGAALVRIGQGLATMGVWLLIVILPIGLVLLLVLAVLFVFRRVFGRGRRGNATVQS